MGGKGRGAVAGVLGLVVLLLWAVAGVLLGLDHTLTIGNIGAGTGLLVFAIVGVVVAFHQPRNPVGWILISFALIFLLGIDAGHYAALCYRLGHHGLPFGPVAVLLAPVNQLAFAIFPLAILLFPDGRLTSARWRWVLGIYAALVAATDAGDFAPAVAAVAAHDIQVDSSGIVESTPHLTGGLAHPPGWLVAGILLSIALIWLSFVAHQALSWRKADGDHRQQLKWLACGAAVSLLVGIGGSSVTSGVLAWILGAGVVALPVSIGVGILKYRLYEIDRIISRTLAYVLVTGLLIGVYAGLVLLATHVLGLHSSVAVAASTLVAAALFNPLRRRVQEAVDRRFNRRRYDADKTIAAFAARLKDAVDLDGVRDDLAGLVHQTLEPAHLTVWIRPPD
jgi:hypothetical protein